MTAVQLDLFGSFVNVIPTSGIVREIEELGTCEDCLGSLSFYEVTRYNNHAGYTHRQFSAIASSVTRVSRGTAYGADYQYVVIHCADCAPRCSWCDLTIDGDSLYQSGCDNHYDTVCSECCECVYVECCNRYIDSDSSDYCSRGEDYHCLRCCDCSYCRRCGDNSESLCADNSYCSSCCQYRCGCWELDESVELVATTPYVSGAYSVIGHKFGVELEMTNPSPRRALEILAAAGLPTTSSYNDLTAWRAKHDGSVNGQDCEVVSPILSGADGMFQLRVALEALNANGATVDRSCGGHVHIDMTDRDGKDLARVLKFYRESEPAINRIIGERSSNSYCRSVNTAQHKELEERLDAATDKRGITNEIYNHLGGSRYHALNLYAFASHETVEFRALEGCLSYERLSAWISFAIAIVRGAMFGQTQPSADLNTLLIGLRMATLIDETSAQHLARHCAVAA